MSEPVAILGVGMMTAVGLSAPETTASVRAATMLLTETSIHDKHFEPITLAEVPEDGIPPLSASLEDVGLTSREGRMLRLASTPLLECLGALPADKPPPGLMLALPEAETTRALDDQAFVAHLGEQAEGTFDVRWSEAGYRGRSGGVRAIGRALDWLDSGRVEFVLAGGVDTYRDTYVLATLDKDQRLKSSSNLDGFIPGEGAGFLLLARHEVAADAGIPVIASVSPISVGSEPGHLHSDEPYRGDGLAGTLANLVQSGVLSEPIREVYSSMNGESHWAKEWGVAVIRNGSALSEDHGMHHPADCFGDTGAACVPLMVGMAALEIRDGFGRSPALVYGSSDREERGALVVSAA